MWTLEVKVGWSALVFNQDHAKWKTDVFAVTDASDVLVECCFKTFWRDSLSSTVKPWMCESMLWLRKSSNCGFLEAGERSKLEKYNFKLALLTFPLGLSYLYLRKRVLSWIWLWQFSYRLDQCWACLWNKPCSWENWKWDCFVWRWKAQIKLMVFYVKYSDGLCYFCVKGIKSLVCQFKMELTGLFFSCLCSILFS